MNNTESSINIKDVTPKVFEQYEFRGWLITIQSYYCTDDIIGFAVPTKYAHILTIDNYMCFDEIAEENKIEFQIDDEGDKVYSDFDYIVAEPDDVVIYHIKGVDVNKSSCVLEYLVKEIIERIGYKNEIEKFYGHNIKHDIVILKQVYKKSITPKAGKRKNGFLNQAWAAMVKARDGKCTSCGSMYDLHAHHILSYKKHPELRLDVNNGVTLCALCHRDIHATTGR